MIDVQELIRRRDEVDKMFLSYSDPSRLFGNTKSLSHLALIGGRLDSMIRRELATRRKMDRQQLRDLDRQIVDVEGSKL